MSESCEVFAPLDVVFEVVLDAVKFLNIFLAQSQVALQLPPLLLRLRAIPLLRLQLVSSLKPHPSTTMHQNIPFVTSSCIPQHTHIFNALLKLLFELGQVVSLVFFSLESFLRLNEPLLVGLLVFVELGDVLVVASHLIVQRFDLVVLRLALVLKLQPCNWSATEGRGRGG